MGIKISPAEAARLTGRTERTVRLWITSGRLPAEPSGFRERRTGVGPYRWLIDVDDLAQIPGIHLDQVYLAELQARHALTGQEPGVLERLAGIEHALTKVRTDIDALRRDLEEQRALLDQLRQPRHQ